jgi:hypothetical protein
MVSFMERWTSKMEDLAGTLRLRPPAEFPPPVPVRENPRGGVPNIPSEAASVEWSKPLADGNIEAPPPIACKPLESSGENWPPARCPVPSNTLGNPSWNLIPDEVVSEMDRGILKGVEAEGVKPIERGWKEDPDPDAAGTEGVALG